MAKRDADKLANRLAQIEELRRQRDEIERKLMILTGLKQEEPAQAKPEGFSYMTEIVLALESGGPMTAPELARAISKKGYKPEVRNVRTMAKYMVSKGRLSMDHLTKKFSHVGQVVGELRAH